MPISESDKALQVVEKYAFGLTYAYEMRNRGIRWAHAAGVSTAQIAKSAGLTRQGVKKILDRTEDDG